METKTFEQKQKELKRGLSSMEILNSDNLDIRSCNFSINTIRNHTITELKKQNKNWGELQVDILVQGVENSDLLKVNFRISGLISEIYDWMSDLEDEWTQNQEFGY